MQLLYITDILSYLRFRVSLLLENNTDSAWNSTVMDILNVSDFEFYTLQVTIVLLLRSVVNITSTS